MDVAVGIDPGFRYIGVAVLRVDCDPPEPVSLFVVDLNGTGSRSHYRDYLRSRASHRRMRRTLHARRQREQQVRRFLHTQNTDPETIERVVHMIRHRGWRSDLPPRKATRVLSRFCQGTNVQAADKIPDKVLDALLAVSPELPEYQEVLRLLQEHALNQDEVQRQMDRRLEVLSAGGNRVKRWEVEQYLTDALPKVLGSTQLAKDIIRIVMRAPRAHGLDNRRVGLCHNPRCNRRAADGRKYPVLWMAAPVLAMIPRFVGCRSSTALGSSSPRRIVSLST